MKIQFLDSQLIQRIKIVVINPKKIQSCIHVTIKMKYFSAGMIENLLLYILGF